MNKRVLFIILPLVIGFSFVAGIYLALKPSLQKWLTTSINQIAQDQLPVQFVVGQVQWSLFLPKISLSEISIQSKPGGLKDIPEIKISKIDASLDLLAIFTGKVSISTVRVEGVTSQINMDPFIDTEGPAEPLPLKEFFTVLKKIPISRIRLEKTNLQLDFNKQSQQVLLNSVELFSINRKTELLFHLLIPDGIIKQKGYSDIPLRVQTEFILRETNLDLELFRLTSFNTVLSAQGVLDEISTIHIKPSGKIEFDVFAELPQLAEAIKSVRTFEKLSGVVKTSGRIQLEKKGLVAAEMKFAGQKIQYEKFDVGNVIFDGEFKDDVLNIPKIQITNEAGLIDIEKLKLSLTKNNSSESPTSEYYLSGKLKSQYFDIHQFLLSIGLKDIPIEIFLAADLDCEGPVLPNANLKCQGQIKGQQIEVRTGDKIQDTLVNVEEMLADGAVNITNKSVTYQADLTMEANKGKSQGVITYDEGFKIQFESNEFDFGNLDRTANLKVEGIAALKGSTQGNSDQATFEIDLNGKQIYFENFYLGDVSSKLRYEKGQLYFDNVKGQILTPETATSLAPSLYEGQLVVNLVDKRISAAAQIPQFEAQHILAVFQRRFTLPVPMTGNGTATVNVEGPFSLGKLSYDLVGKINQGSVAGDSFDLVDIALKSVDGNMKVEKAILRKNRSEILMEGVSNPQGQVDLAVQTKNWALENSENISQIGSQISGILDAKMTLKGFVLSPDVLFSGEIKSLTIEEKDYPDSQFSTELSRQNIKGQLNLFANQLVSEFVFPLTPSSEFLLKARAQDWKYAALFSLIGGGSLLNDYETNLSGNLQFSSEQGGFWNCTGQAQLTELELKRGNLSLINKLPIEMEMKQGIGSFKNFRIESTGADSAFFEIQSERFSQSDLTMRIDGTSNLRLFQIFVPFLEELSGIAKININTAGPTSKPEILGTAKIEDGFVKLKVFPHPLEKIKANIQFSQSKVLISDFTGNLAGGNFFGDGSVLILGPKNLPVNVKAQFRDVSLNFPQGMRTSGLGELSFTGNTFPYVFSGSYRVLGGFVDKEFQDQEAQENNLKQSDYLPKNISQTSSDPIELDLLINIERPLPVKNSLLDGTVVGAVSIRGPPSQFRLGGRVSTERGSKALFRDKVFDIQTANVQFNNTTEVNPELYISANSRITQYDIAMLIQGTAKSPLVRLSSTPPLSDQDIISLIALGIRSESLEKQFESTQKSEQATADALGGLAAGVLTQIQPVKKLQETTGVEIQFSTLNDDTKNVSLQRVTLSKKITDKVRAAATQISGNYSAQEYTLQYNFTDNVSAIGRYEERRPNETSGDIEKTTKESQNILGLDLEFKREFK